MRITNNHWIFKMYLYFMKKTLKVVLSIILLFSVSLAKAQSYCVQFSKEKRDTVFVNENKKVSFVLLNDSLWNKGVITRISSDSIFIEHSVFKADTTKAIPSGYEIKGYTLSDFKMLAYPKTSSVVRGATIIILLATVMVAAAAVGAADGFAGIGAGLDDGVAQKKFFQKNIDFEEDWFAEIVKCE